MEKTTTESTRIAADSAGPPRTGSQKGQEEGAARSPCPACGIGVRQRDRFCRRCGIDLDQAQSTITVSLYATAAFEQGNTEQRQNMTTSSNRFDLVVIGSGPAGQKGAIAAAKLGKRVAIVERRGMIGGMSLHTGAIPSKTLREAVLYLTGYRQRAFYGRDYKLKREISVADLLERVNAVIAREMAVIKEQLGRNGIANDQRHCAVYRPAYSGGRR